MNAGEGEKFCLSIEDIEKLHTPPTASIIQIGRLGWLRKVLPRIRDSHLEFVEVKKGPEFRSTFTRVLRRSPFRIEVPFVSDLRVEMTVDGDPAVLIIDKMYRLDSGWKIFDAVLSN